MGGSSSVSRPNKRTDVARTNNDKLTGYKSGDQNKNDHIAVSMTDRDNENSARKKNSTKDVDNNTDISNKPGKDISNATVMRDENAYSSDIDGENNQMDNGKLETNKIVKQSSANERDDTSDPGVIDIDRCNEEELGRLIKTFLAKAASKETKMIKYTGQTADNLTDNENQMVSKLVVARMKRLVDEMKAGEWITRTGQYSKRARHFLSVFHDAHEILDAVNANLDDFVKTLGSLAKLAEDTNIIETICELVIDIYQRRIIKYWTSPYLWKPLRYGLGILWNYTDVSEEWAVRVAKSPDFLEIVHKVLFDLRIGTTLSAFTEEQQWVLLAALEITHNISMIDSNIRILREKQFIEALQPHLASSNKSGHLAALSSLAGIVNEEESEIIASNKKVVKHLMKVLRKGLQTEERRYHGEYDSWNCTECAVTIKRLARNDANKKILVELGALQLLIELAKGTTVEQIEAVNAIWVLSFDEEAVKTLNETERSELVDLMRTFKDSPSEKLKEAVNGTLWNLREESRIETLEQVEPAIIEEKAKADKKFVMISYNWGEKELVMALKNELVRHGINVWIDVEQQLSGSLFEAIVTATDTAAIFLMCYSQKYKTSPNNRMEAEYAFTRRKAIIPVKVENGYKPDGWLGFIVGANLVHDISDGSKLEGDGFKRLLEQINTLLSRT